MSSPTTQAPSSSVSQNRGTFIQSFMWSFSHVFIPQTVMNACTGSWGHTSCPQKLTDQWRGPGLGNKAARNMGRQRAWMGGGSVEQWFRGQEAEAGKRQTSQGRLQQGPRHRALEQTRGLETPHMLWKAGAGRNGKRERPGISCRKWEIAGS